MALLAINTDRRASKAITVSAASGRYTLTAPDLEGTRVDLNGKELKLEAGDSIPQLKGIAARSGEIALPPAGITFLAIRNAHNSVCH